MKKISDRVLCEGKWLIFKEAVYENRDGRPVVWEYIERKHSSDTVVIIPKLVPSNRYVLIKQFRCALDNYVIGFPAGIKADGGGDPLDELREETGYFGKIVGESPRLSTSSGVMDSSTVLFYVEIDESDPRNIAPHQDLEPEEDITVFILEKEKIAGFLERESAKGTSIGSGVWAFFFGREANA
ncbi:MAG: NUDIX hydrolase [Candidatus Omnitrophica bacterium]|nr:NUDIX hydrolase [Candidatus Omnitrophota bacterium]